MVNHSLKAVAYQPAQVPARSTANRRHLQRSRSLDSSLPRFVWPSQQQPAVNQQHQQPPPPYHVPQLAPPQLVNRQQQPIVPQRHAEHVLSPESNLREQQQQHELNLQPKNKKQKIYIPDYSSVNPGQAFYRGMTPSPEPEIRRAEPSSHAPYPPITTPRAYFGDDVCRFDVDSCTTDNDPEFNDNDHTRERAGEDDWVDHEAWPRWVNLKKEYAKPEDPYKPPRRS
ncbi:hypothetical protein BCR35DRAFT_305590 [Leucosporidium creatinivorum]|uniref:Uncharacterized protein n=1 Tax=Leucosporidium creatinivorum TaxID=106004 RepID=A0A1Y2EZD7_9BASI|nr:hypothetical protein BCR35DRAFT_305590 [Leucosporidium creatinivorum]